MSTSEAKLNNLLLDIVTYAELLESGDISHELFEDMVRLALDETRTDSV